MVQDPRFRRVRMVADVAPVPARLVVIIEAAGVRVEGVDGARRGAGPGAYRVFRDGVVLVERDHRALAQRKAQAILGYLDFRPLEEIAVRGVLAAAARGR